MHTSESVTYVTIKVKNYIVTCTLCGSIDMYPCIYMALVTQYALYVVGQLTIAYIMLVMDTFVLSLLPRLTRK